MHSNYTPCQASHRPARRACEMPQKQARQRAQQARQSSEGFSFSRLQVLVAIFPVSPTYETPRDLQNALAHASHAGRIRIYILVISARARASIIVSST